MSITDHRITAAMFLLLTLSTQSFGNFATAAESQTEEQTNGNQNATPESGPDFSISDVFHIDEVSEQLLDKYTASLNALGMSDSLIGNLMIVIITGLFLTLSVWLNKRLANLFERRLKSIRSRFHLDQDRFFSYLRIQIIAGYVLAICLFFYAILGIFQLLPEGLSELADGAKLVEFAITVLTICLLAATFWEAPNALMEYAFHKGRWSTARKQTLLPVIRNIMLTSLSIMFTLVLLSEIGIDIVPILAGAGIAGIAIGFGAQTLVKDFLTGFIVVFEDLLQVGDVVKVGGRDGIVERITLRKIQLRNLDGTVHTVPFSEVDVVDNYTKEYSYYLMDIGVAYREDVDEVISCLEGVDADMRNDTTYGKLILDSLEVLGVDKFADSAVIIRARTKTQAHEKWAVGREFNRRIKLAFDERNIEIPFPHQTLYFGEDKQGQAPAAQVKLQSNDKTLKSMPEHETPSNA